MICTTVTRTTAAFSLLMLGIPALLSMQPILPITTSVPASPTSITTDAVMTAAVAPGIKTTEDFDQLARRCAPSVHPATLAALVQVESGYNPYAIGVVGGQLSAQPTSLKQALSAVAQLEAEGKNFSMGLGQINRVNLKRYGVNSQTIFAPCKNLEVGAAILTACFTRAKKRFSREQQALRAAFSCYYSGNFTTGFAHGYVQKVLAQAEKPPKAVSIVPAIMVQDGATTVMQKSTAIATSTTTSARTHRPVQSTQKNVAQGGDSDDIYAYVAPTAHAQAGQVTQAGQAYE